MVTSPAASEAPLSEGGCPASSDVTWNHLDSVSAVGMPQPQAAFPAGFQPFFGPYQSLQTGGSDPNVLQMSHVIWELQQMNMQLMQQMTMVQQHVFGHGQQSSASPQVAPRRSRNNKAPRARRTERKMREEAWAAAEASLAGQGVEGDRAGATEPQCKSDVDWSAAAVSRAGQGVECIGATEPQCKSDVESWEMPEAYVDERIKMLKLDTSSTQDHVKELRKALEGAVKQVTEDMDEQREQFAHLSKVASALRKEMDEQFKKKAAAAAQLESEQSVLRGAVDELLLEVGAVKKSLDDERQARTKSMEAIMMEKMATKEWVNKQLGQLQSDATASLHLTVKDAVDSVLQDRPTEQLRVLKAALTDVDAELSALKEMCKEGQTQLQALQTTVEKKMTTVDEQLGQVREQNRKATAAQDAAVAQLRSEIDLQERAMTAAAVELDAVKGRLEERQAQAMSMATTEKMAKELGQTGGQISKLSSAVADVDAKLNAVQVKTAAQTTVVKTTTNKLRPVDVRDVRSKLQLLLAKNRHEVDVFVHLCSNCDVHLVLYDGSLMGPPARTDVKFNGFSWEVADVAGLQRLVEERLASDGLEGARLLYAKRFFFASFPLPLVQRNLNLPDLQRLLRSPNVRITEKGAIIDNDN